MTTEIVDLPSYKMGGFSSSLCKRLSEGIGWNIIFLEGIRFINASRRSRSAEFAVSYSNPRKSKKDWKPQKYGEKHHINTILENVAIFFGGCFNYQFFHFVTLPLMGGSMRQLIGTQLGTANWERCASCQHPVLPESYPQWYVSPEMIDQSTSNFNSAPATPRPKSMKPGL